MLTIFDQIPQLTEEPATFLPYDSTVQKNVNTVFRYPFPKETFIPEPNLFFSNKDWNQFVDQVYSNLDYLVSQSKLWNPFIPGIHQEAVFENLPNHHSFHFANDLHYLIDKTTLKVLSGQNIVETLSCSPLDNFFNLKEIEITQDRLYVIDEHLVFAWNFPSFEFEGFFGGYGGPSEKTRFNSPCSIAANENYIFVADTNNSSIKIYDCNFQFIFRAVIPFKPQAIEVNENYLFVAGNSSKLYRFDLGDFRCFHVFDLPMSNITKIRNDVYQDGFLYIVNKSGKAIKYTQDGLTVGTFRPFASPIIDVAKYETTLIIYFEDGSMHHYLDHSFFYTLLSEECDFDRSKAYVQDEELNASYLSYNKSLEYIYDDLLCYADSLTGSFANIVSEFQDEKLGIEIIPVSCNMPPSFGKENYFGKDDPFIWEIMKRAWERICQGLQELEFCYRFGIVNPVPIAFDCIPVSALRADRPQKPSQNAFPITIKEIQPQFNKFNFNMLFPGDDCDKNWCDVDCFFGNETSSCTTWYDISAHCDVLCMSAVRWCDFCCPQKELECLVDIFKPSSACSAITIENFGDRQILTWDFDFHQYTGTTFALKWEMDYWNLYNNEIHQKEMENNLFDPTNGWENTDDCIVICNGRPDFICYFEIEITDVCDRHDILTRQEIISQTGETGCIYEHLNWILQYNHELGYWDLISTENGDIWSYPIANEYDGLSANPQILDPDNDMIFTLHALRSQSFNLPKDMIVRVL